MHILYVYVKVSIAAQPVAAVGPIRRAFRFAQALLRAAEFGRYALGAYEPNIAAVLLLPLTTISIVIPLWHE